MSDLAIEMVKVGESTGALTEMLAHVSEFYDEEIEAHLARMTAMIEPAILICPWSGHRRADSGALPPPVPTHRCRSTKWLIRALYHPGDAASEAARARKLAEDYGFEFVPDLDHFQVDHSLFREIPLELMIRYQFIPERRENGHISVIVGDPTDVLKLDELELLLGSPIKVKVSSGAAIRDKLQKSESTQRVLDEATEGFKLQLVGEDEDGEKTLTMDTITQQDASPIIRLVDSIVFNAIQRRASDIHIETRDNEVVVKYQSTASSIRPSIQSTKNITPRSSRASRSCPSWTLRRSASLQDGRFKLRITGRTIDFRVSIVPTVHGEDSVIRILDKESMNKEFKNLRLDVLGFDEDMLVTFRKFIKEPYGMVLVTGPTGSGKTTTLYAALSKIQSPEDKIVTIEDPVEYQIRGITQIPVNEKKGLTFARGLRSILRHDPDKIMVGEIRDEETAQIAVQSALTGHLVFTTVHANNVVDVLGRFLNMKVDSYNFVSALNCVLAQRLVRKICEFCRQEAKDQTGQLAESGLSTGPARGQVV